MYTVNRFALEFFNIIKDQINLNECFINITVRTFVHNFERTSPEG